MRKEGPACSQRPLGAFSGQGLVWFGKVFTSSVAQARKNITAWGNLRARCDGAAAGRAPRPAAY